MTQEIVRELVDGVWVTRPKDQTGGGGSQPELLRFAFAFDTPGLSDGIEFWTPTLNQQVVDAWFETTEAWDNANPALGDVGVPGGSPAGLFAYATGGPQPDMTSNAWYDGSGAGAFLNASTFSQILSYAQDTSPAVPLKIAVATPWKVWVSQDGTPGGDDPGSATGAAAICVRVLTPAAP